jgi:hypothetical protein
VPSVKIDDIIAANPLDGTERFVVEQGAVGPTSRTRTTLLSLVRTYILSGEANSATMRQVRGWAATNGSPVYLYTISNDIATNHSDIADAIYIQWEYGSYMVTGDTLYTYLQTLLGFPPPMATIRTYPA